MWDNNIVSTSSKIAKHQKIDHSLTNRIISNSFQHNTVDSTIILPSIVKNKKLKLNQQTSFFKVNTVLIPLLPYHYTIVY